MEEGTDRDYRQAHGHLPRPVDPTSTEEAIKKAHAADVVEGEEHAKVVVATTPGEPPKPAEPEEDAGEFSQGILD